MQLFVFEKMSATDTACNSHRFTAVPHVLNTMVFALFASLVAFNVV